MLAKQAFARSVAILTTGRADFSSVRPIVREALSRPGLEVVLLVTGSHESGSLAGITEGTSVDRSVSVVWGPLGRAYAPTELSVEWLADYTRWINATIATVKPDLLLLTGDRFELLPAATAAMLHQVPLAHLSGGDITVGSVDNQVRFAISMMSSVHFVSNVEHADRLVAMGESPLQVNLVGDPALDDIPEHPLMTRAATFDELGLASDEHLALVTYHAPTIGSDAWSRELDAILLALSSFHGAVVITGTNGDPNSGEVAVRLGSFAKGRSNTVLIESLGQGLYYEVLHHASFMIGNSSSGIWEAPSVGLRVINVGDRQAGRIRAGNVIDVNADEVAISGAIASALSEVARQRPLKHQNPYAQPNSAKRVVDGLQAIRLNAELLRKDFIDRPPAVWSQVRS